VNEDTTQPANPQAFEYVTHFLLGDVKPVQEAAQHATKMCPLQARHYSCIHDAE
jgi:hypothetical protein